MKSIATNVLPTMAFVAALFAIPAASPVSAQETIRACYVPNTGVIYRIGTEDTANECRSERHVEFDWEQQPPAGALAAVTFATAATPQLRTPTAFEDLLTTSFTTTADGPAVISFFANAARLFVEGGAGILYRLMVDGTEVIGIRPRHDFESLDRDGQMHGFDWAVNLAAGEHTVAVEWVGVCAAGEPECATIDARSLIVRHGN